MKKAYQVRFLRRLVLPFLERVNAGDITIRHHWTGDRFALHSYKHRSYWYRGKPRKRETMQLFSDLIGEGDFVVEIGAHIGYVSLYLAHLIGPEGRLVVFEPGPDNLKYLRQNTASNPRISVVGKAVTDHVGSATLYVDDRTGLNSSLVRGYSVLARNQQRARVNSAEENGIQVPCTSLDDFLSRSDLSPPIFVKIDAEGAELSVLCGMKRTLGSDGIALMVEVTEKAPEVWSLLKGAGFLLYGPNASPVHHPDEMRGDIFCIRGNDDRVGVFYSYTQAAS